MPQEPRWWQNLVGVQDDTPGKVLGQFQSQDLPAVVTPRAFRNEREPFVVGQELGKSVDRLLKLAPNLRAKLKSVVQGPTSASISQMIRSKLPPDAFANTTLLGITDRSPGHAGEVGLSPALSNDVPRFDGSTLDSVLAHELAHVSGKGEVEARLAEKAYGGNAAALKLGQFMKDPEHQVMPEMERKALLALIK